jgi:hypothetical protein
MTPPAAARLDAGLEMSMRAAYVLVVLVCLWVLLPGLRAKLRDWMALQIYAYRVGRWGEEFSRMPAWRREGLKVRGKAPAGLELGGQAPTWAKRK